jgi:hypothetical protein
MIIHNFFLPKRQLPQVIATLQQCGAQHKIPLVRALADERITFFEVPRGADFFERRIFDADTLPVVCVIGDDDFTSSGPSGFPVAADMLRWSKARIIHGAGGEASHYEGAVLTAEKLGNCVIIETSSDCVDPWLKFTKSILGDSAPHTLVIQAKDRPHPVMGTRQ